MALSREGDRPLDAPKVGHICEVYPQNKRAAQGPNRQLIWEHRDKIINPLTTVEAMGAFENPAKNKWTEPPQVTGSCNVGESTLPQLNTI